MIARSLHAAVTAAHFARCSIVAAAAQTIFAPFPVL
jgi:hypothetical protein